MTQPWKEAGYVPVRAPYHFPLKYSRAKAMVRRWRRGGVRRDVTNLWWPYLNPSKGDGSTDLTTLYLWHCEGGVIPRGPAYRKLIRQMKGV